MVKKKKKSLSESVVSDVTANVAVGMIPNVGGSPAVTTLKTGFATGMSNVAKTYPTRGKLAGAGMLIKSVGKLKKKGKKLL